MRFNLVDGGLDLGKVLKVEVAVGAEVGNADGTELAGLVEPLHRAVRAVVIAERLVDEQQVEIVGLQLAHRLFDGRLGLFITRVRDPHLGRQEKLLARKAALLQRRAHALFIVIGLRGVDAAVADADGVEHAALRVLGRRLVDAVAQLRHFDAVVQRDIFHDDTSKILKCRFS